LGEDVPLRGEASMKRASPVAFAFGLSAASVAEPAETGGRGPSTNLLPLVHNPLPRDHAWFAVPHKETCMAKCLTFGLIALCLVPTIAAAKGNKVSMQPIQITKSVDKSSPSLRTTPPPAGPIPLPYPNSGGSKNRK